jgi:hypothetical protein
VEDRARGLELVSDLAVGRTRGRTQHDPGSQHQLLGRRPTVRRLADELDLSRSTVHRIWRQRDLKPHQSRTFKYSNDPELEAKVIDVVGLYLNPPDNALVLCVDSKTQIQALDRTQPILPLKQGQAERHTHDYKRNGTTSLYAASTSPRAKSLASATPATATRSSSPSYAAS